MGTTLRDHYGFSLRQHPVEPTVGGDLFLPRLADSRTRTCWIRSHVSEMVRRRLLGQEEMAWFTQWRQTEMAMLTLGAVILVIMPDNEMVDDWLPPTWQRHGVDAVTEEYDQATWLMRAAAGRWRCHLPTRWVTRRELVDDHGRPTKQLNDIASAAAKYETMVARLPPPALGVGSLWPETIIIGEEPAPSVCPVGCCGDSPDLPFSRGPTSNALWQALDAIGFRWWTSYVTNASTFREGTPWDFLDVLSTLNRDGNVRKIIALGKEAESLMRRTWVSAYVAELQGRGFLNFVRHPSHVRRWHPQELQHFRDEIANWLGSCTENIDDAIERTGTQER